MHINYPGKDIEAERKFDRLYQIASPRLQDKMMYAVDWLTDEARQYPMDITGAKCVIIQTFEFILLPEQTQRHEAQAARQRKQRDALVKQLEEVEV